MMESPSKGGGIHCVHAYILQREARSILLRLPLIVRNYIYNCTLYL